MPMMTAKIITVVMIIIIMTLVLMVATDIDT